MVPYQFMNLPSMMDKEPSVFLLENLILSLQYVLLDPQFGQFEVHVSLARSKKASG